MFRDLINGIRSGYPLCCILFFIKNNTDTTALDVDYRRNNVKMIEYYNGELIGYIPKDISNYVKCDKCFQKHN